MTGTLRIALSQIDAVVGDIPGNEAKIRDGLRRARSAGAQMVLFPELAVTGYPPEDLLLKEHFLADARAAVERIAQDATGIVAIVGYPERGLDVYNAAAVLADGAVRANYRKVHLPNYGVFDEVRYFQSGPGAALIEVDGIPVGLTICEDIWQPGIPMSLEALAGATVVVNISASPYVAGKGIVRERMIAQRARDHLVRGRVLRPRRRPGRAHLRRPLLRRATTTATVIARAPQFREDLLIAEIDPQAALSAACATRAAARGPRDARGGPHLGSFTVRDGATAPRAHRTARSRRCSTPRRDLRGARARHARLRREERLPPRRHRAVAAASTRRSSRSSPSTRSAPTRSRP